DAPPTARLGLPAGGRHAHIAPPAPPAPHMPPPLFTPPGYWDEPLAPNRRSPAAEPDSNAAVHPMDYMVYAYLQEGRDAEAKRVVDRTPRDDTRSYASVAGYNLAAMPVRYALERGRW